ncbi:phage portal protein [Companilactobacillus zhongbaensis]|uniref:phage portal protein n=1 Tax=Companilactobacillus zhongbaensis TaxID=2486009 RepID=UPI000F79B2DB|nr:phage portal protein [Companilactobacillus zhongbaensis]
MFFKPVKKDPSDAFLDAVVSMQTDDSSVYYGANAINNSDVFSAIRILASDVASSPIQLLRGETLAVKDKYFNLLNKKPNDLIDGFHLKFALMANLLLNGNAYAEIDDVDNPREIKFVKNSSMTVKQDEDSGALIYEISNSKNQTRRVKPSHILHFKYFSQDGVTGVSPLMSLRDELNLQKTGNKMLMGFYKNGISSNGVLKVNKSDLDADAKNHIRDEFEKVNAGSQNSSRTIVMDSSMDYTPLEINADVLKLVNSNDWSSKQIAKVFGLSTYQLGVEENHSSVSQTNLNYINGTLSHYFNVFSAELDFKLLSNTDKQSFRFNTDSLFSVDPQTATKNAIQAVQGGLITINEARRKMNLSPLDGGDQLLVSLNYVHLDNMDNYQNNKDGKGETNINEQ